MQADSVRGEIVHLCRTWYHNGQVGSALGKPRKQTLARHGLIRGGRTCHCKCYEIPNTAVSVSL